MDKHTDISPDYRWNPKDSIIAKELVKLDKKIDVYKTIGEIQGILVENGAQRIMFEYEGKQPVAIKFQIDTKEAQGLNCRLPARPKAVQKVLEQMKREKGSRMSVKPDFSQACRVAWRVVKDWIEAQISMIQTEQMEFSEVFLSHLLNSSGKTLLKFSKRVILCCWKISIKKAPALSGASFFPTFHPTSFVIPQYPRLFSDYLALCPYSDCLCCICACQWLPCIRTLL
jgi:hypothetical protein